MGKIKSYLLIAWGLITALFYILIQSKNRKIEKQQNEINHHKSKNEELSYINEQEAKAKHEKNAINASSEPDVDRLLDEHKAYRD